MSWWVERRFVLGLAACAATRGRRSEPMRSGFLGDYSKLEPGPTGGARLRYVNPNVVWSRYDAIHLDSVTLWADKETVALKDEEKQMLTDILYKALYDKLGTYFTMVDHPGPRVIRIRAALTQAKGANVPLRTMTTFIPQMFLISTATGLSTDTASTVGTATAEIEAVDSITGEQLAAAVDQRAGTKSILAGSRTFQKWGDVQAAAEFWAERAARFLLGEGVRRKAGAPAT
jgi:hypothetical protein